MTMTLKLPLEAASQLAAGLDAGVLGYQLPHQVQIEVMRALTAKTPDVENAVELTLPRRVAFMLPSFLDGGVMPSELAPFLRDQLPSAAAN